MPRRPLVARSLLVLCLILAVGMLPACGMKGPLYIPEPEERESPEKVPEPTDDA